MCSYMVGPVGLEPTTNGLKVRCIYRLSYDPMLYHLVKHTEPQIA